MIASRAPSRNPSSASIHTPAATAAQQASANAALLGATTAFARPSNTQRIGTNHTGQSIGGGARTTTGTSDVRHDVRAPARSSARSPMPSTTGRQGGSIANIRSQEASSESSLLTLPMPQRPTHSRSPSAHAAALATARAPSPSVIKTAAATKTQQKPPVAQKPRRLSNMSREIRAATRHDQATDPTPIPPTTSLVNMFERKASTASHAASHAGPGPIIAKPSPDLAVKSPKPVRADAGFTPIFQIELGSARPPDKTGAKALTDEHRRGSREELRREETNASDQEFYASASEDVNGTASHAFASGRNDSAAPSTRTSPLDVLKSPSDTTRRQPRLSPSPLRTSATTLPIAIQPPSRTDTSLSAASSTQSQSYRSIPAQYNSAYPKRMTPLTTGDELANALVASSLASSRAPSPRKELAPPVPSRRKKKHHKIPGFSRTPSPIKTGMRHTLRDKNENDEDSEDEDDSQHPYHKHQRKRLVRKHPNKHHEGDRKRWRDAVTERERKRYEGVWAANKGLHSGAGLNSASSQNATGLSALGDSISPSRQSLSLSHITSNTAFAAGPAPEQEVSSIVVRDIWSRSRLPLQELEVVWDLVDHDCIGRLSKEEFVVGMWLIDQRLKGRKLPVKVTESVWASVRRIEGIKVRQMR